MVGFYDGIKLFYSAVGTRSKNGLIFRAFGILNTERSFLNCGFSSADNGTAPAASSACEVGCSKPLPALFIGFREMAILEISIGVRSVCIYLFTRTTVP
jgi:hypothetical protein